MLVLQAFDDLYDTVPQICSEKKDLLKHLFQYFEHQWIKTVDLKIWNVYGIEIRTNNNAEGFLIYSIYFYIFILLLHF